MVLEYNCSLLSSFILLYSCMPTPHPSYTPTTEKLYQPRLTNQLKHLKKNNKIPRLIYQLHFIGYISLVMIKGNLTIMELESWAERISHPTTFIQ